MTIEEKDGIYRSMVALLKPVCAFLRVLVVSVCSVAIPLQSAAMQAASSFIVEPIGLTAESLPKPINWTALFGNDHRVELEIGMGKGTFLT